MVVLTTNAPTNLELERTATITGCVLSSKRPLQLAAYSTDGRGIIKGSEVAGCQTRVCLLPLQESRNVGEACCSREGYEAARRCSQWDSDAILVES